ncbi:MAG: transporter substrate-binding domain-containing protein [Desulfobacterales bacterium]|nr:transporter substrate-binding domain-containing protein [Desulfobacterales bacterium]
MGRLSKLMINAIFFILMLILISPIYGMDIVNVGGYVFPPFIEYADNIYTGITLDLIEEMNNFQSKYKFTFVPTSSKRRYKNFENKLYDIILFEGIEWGWKEENVESTKIFFKGGEVYVTKNFPSKTQSYFDDLKGKKLAIYLGYHYKFANFNADEEYLKKNFNAETSLSHIANISKVLNGKADIAVVTKSYLKKYLNENPQIKKQLLISTKLDQEYNLGILTRKSSKSSAKELNLILDGLEKSGRLSLLWEKYGLMSK